MKMTCGREDKCPAIWLALILAASGTLAHAQNPVPANPALSPRTDRMVCPLSDTQTSSSIAAFAKVASAFTLEDNGRCGNCHGGVNPFVDENAGHHAGGARNAAGNMRDACQDCHSGLPGWNLPSADMFFMDGYQAPRNASVICKQIRGTFVKAQPFVNHIAKNTDLADFNGTAFLGTRGLNQLGQALAYGQPYHPEPPNISRDEMVQRVRSWVSAMGGEFKGDASCGCEPLQFAVEVLYGAQISIPGLLQSQAVMGPVSIPIHFHGDGSFEGQGVLPFAGKGMAGVGPAYCADQSQGGMMVKVSGNAVEQFSENHMHIDGTNLTRMNGTNAQACNLPVGSGVFDLKGGDKATFVFDLVGKVGEEKQFPFPLPGPIVAVVRVKVVDLSAQGVNQ